MQAGVSSFKIEGRLKSAAVRRRHDADLSGRRSTRPSTDQPFAISNAQKQNLAQSFSRGFTHGFLDGVNHQKLVPRRFPRAAASASARSSATTQRGVLVELDRVSSNGRMQSTPATAARSPATASSSTRDTPSRTNRAARDLSKSYAAAARNDHRDSTFGHGDVESLDADRTPARIVWKTDDPAHPPTARTVLFARRGRQPRAARRQRVAAPSASRCELTLRDDTGHSVRRAIRPGRSKLAPKSSADAESLREQFGRLGDTPFELRDARPPKPLGARDGAQERAERPAPPGDASSC